MPNPTTPEPVIRFCPGCGSVGPVPDTFKDCCPDGKHAREIPEPLAQRCRDLFYLALEANTAQEPVKPLFAAAVAARKWAELQDNGHRMQSILFDGGNGGPGTIDPWGVVRWGATEAEPVRVPVDVQRDAERYRWLRDVSVPPHNLYLSVPDEFDGVRYAPAEVDAYIDAATLTAAQAKGGA